MGHGRRCPGARPTARPIVLNTTGDVASGVDEIRTAMIEQVHRPVRWVQTVNTLRTGGTDTVVEVGDSKALCSFNRDIDRSLRTFTLAEPGAVADPSRVQPCSLTAASRRS